MRRSLSAAVAAACALGGLVTAAPPANATGSCGSAPAVTGVTTGQVGPASQWENWYHHESLVGLHAVTVTSAPVPVALAVYDGSCALLCQTTPTVGQLFPQVCAITTPTLVLNIEVAHYGSPFDALYVLTVA
jgi:hypothetical protein